MIREGTVSL